MIRRNRRNVIFFLLIVLTLSSTMVSYGRSETKEAVDYEIETMKELKQNISNLEKTKKITQKTWNDIMKETDPKVAKAFRIEKAEKAKEWMNQIDPDEVMEEQGDGSLYGKKTYDLGDACSVTVEFEDNEEKSLIQKVVDKFIEPSYAAVNGEKKWKDYGKRYFTARANTLFGAGGATMTFENHYTLSSRGIEERDPVIDCNSITYKGGMVVPKGFKITDSVATKPGASDVNAYGKFAWSTVMIPNEIQDISVNGKWELHTRVEYLTHNTGTQQIRVGHSWKLI